MKRQTLLICIPLLLLSACQGGGGASSSAFVPTTVNFQRYNMYQAVPSLVGKDGNIHLEDQDPSAFELGFLPDQPYLPYAKVADYVKAMGEVEPFIQEERDLGTSYSITFKRDNTSFSFSFDNAAKSITIAGDYYYIVQGSDEKDLSSNAIEGKVTNGVIGDKNKPYVLSFAETELTPFSYNGALYAPFALLDTIFYKLVNVGLFFAYDRIYAYSEPMVFNKLKFVDEEVTTPYTVSQGMRKTITETVMPLYVREHTRDIFAFLMDNYYGLKYSMKIDSVARYFKSTTYYKDFVSEDPQTRANAISSFIARLNDGHTALIYPAAAWDERATENIPQSIIETRETIEQSLLSSRKKVYDSLGLKTNQVRYSKDGSTAVFTLEKFAAYQNYFDEKTGKATTTIEEATAEDTYLQSKAHFEEIDKKGGVKNVIIDMSLNEGGDSGTMGNLLTLISKNNKSTMYFHDMLTGNVQTTETRLDMNRDGKIDERDVTYGDKYGIYLLVSPCAFSCGTAYPFYAAAHGFATIIGQKPGGGECTLGQAVLPGGSALVHSSMLRVAYPEGDHYVYDEGGPALEETFDYGEFYDLEGMVKKLSEED